MGSFLRRHLALLLGSLCLVPAALWQLVLLAKIMASRIDYPMDLEWMEGGALYHAYRLLQGQSLYPDPAGGFVPFPYPPLHPLVLALAGRLGSLDYAAGRAVSILFFVLILAVCAGEVLRDSRQRGAALLGAAALMGYVAASVPVMLSWYDLVRNDGMALALPMLAAACVSGRLSPGRIVACALLLSLAFFTKQTAIFFMAFLGLAVCLRSPRLGGLLAGVTCLLCGLLLGALQWTSDGWYYRWISVLNTHPLSFERLWLGTRLVLAFAPFLPGIALLAVWLRRRGVLTPRSLVWLAMLAAAIPASLLPFAKIGGFNNNLMPLVVIGGLAATRVVIDGFDALVAHTRRTASPRLERALAVAAVLGGVAFFFVNRYDAQVFMPTPELRARAVALNQLVAGLEGAVLMPSHPFIPIRNGKTNDQMHVMSWWDASQSPLASRLDSDAFLARSDPDWLLAAPIDLSLPAFAAAFERRFVLERRLPAPPQTLVGASPTGPEFLFRRLPR